MAISSVEQILDKFRDGQTVIVVDEDSGDSEGFLCAAAEKTSPDTINFMLSRGRGVIYLALTEDRMKQLGIPHAVEQSASFTGNPWGVPIGARCVENSGVSAAGRATTIRTAVKPEAKPSDFIVPGHVLPVQARKGGILVRTGQIEASMDLARLAGLEPAGVICQILRDDGSVALMPDLEKFALQHGLGIVTIADLIAFRLKGECLVRREWEADFPTIHGGTFKAIVYKSNVDSYEHMALVKGQLEDLESILVRMHSECLTGDVFGSERCDCGDQINRSLKLINEEGKGVLVYMHQEGRGIGLTNKIKAYALQDQGLDTVEANLELGFGEDLRDYGIAAQILRDLNVHRLRLLTNNPRKIIGLEGYGLAVVKRIALEVEPQITNIDYLRTKREKLGHLLSTLGVNPHK
jgi:3,4-dihydroxy 2-butanone 4-phosphate synthase/GTP cyclohydrolase II